MKKDVRIVRIEPNDYNPNVLKGEKFEALKADVKAGNYDPILVSPKSVFYGEVTDLEERFVIIDGEWRWRASVELGLITIKAEVKEIAIFEAKTITYKKNRQRGNMHPFKEAKLFDEEVKAGVTEQDVANRYGVTRSYVAGRRSLLKVSGEVVELFERPEKKLKERIEKQIREDIEENRQQPEYVEVSDEEVEAHVEKEVAEVVPRGTLSPGHLKALAALPKKEQVKIAEEVVSTDLNVRSTEDRVKRVREKLDLDKRFQKALKKARQPTCPHCGSPPARFHYSGEDRFYCAQCYNPWDYMVTKKELQEQKKKRQRLDKQERAKGSQAKLKNPAYVRRNETTEEIAALIKPWILRKLKQLDKIESIRITGFRGKEVVDMVYPTSYHRGLDFRVGVKEPGQEWHQWKKTFSFSMEDKAYKTLEEKSKLDLHVQKVSPEKRVEVHRFLDEIVNTDQDPFLPDKGIEELLKKYGEIKETA